MKLVLEGDAKFNENVLQALNNWIKFSAFSQNFAECKFCTFSKTFLVLGYLFPPLSKDRKVTLIIEDENHALIKHSM